MLHNRFARLPASRRPANSSRHPANSSRHPANSSRHPANRRALVAAVVVGSLFAFAAPAFAGKLTPKDDANNILLQGLKSADFYARGMAYEGIAFNKRNKDLKQLLKDGTDDPQWVVRAGIVRAYVQLRDKAWKKVVHDSLIRATTRTYDVLPVLEAVKAKEAVSVILDILADKEHERQDAIADGIVRVNPAYLAAVVNAAVRSKDSVVSEAGLRILKQLDVHQHAAHLGPIAKSSGKNAAVVKAMVALADRAKTGDETGFLKNLKPSDKALAEQVTLARAKHGDKSVGKTVLKIAAGLEGKARVKALQMYKPIASKDHGKQIAALLGDKPDGALALAVYEILALLGDRSMAAGAQKLAMGTDVTLRPAGVYYLGRVGGAGRLGEMHRYLSDGIADVRIAAARVVGFIASPISVGPLREGLDAEKTPQVRFELLRALTMIRHKKAVETLMFYTRERDDELRGLVVRALANSGEKAARGGLQTALRDRSKEVRFEAVRGFIVSDPANAVKVFKRSLSWLPHGSLLKLTREFGEPIESYLELALFSKRFELRDEAIDALSLLPKKQSALLKKVLSTTGDDDLRIRLIKRLVKLEGKKVANEIKALAMSAPVRVRIVAIRQLGKMKDKESKKLLISSLGETNQRLRIAAALTLLGG